MKEIPMTASLLARVMVTSVSAGQGITAVFIDLNRTHATNPLWIGHARFHVVQQTFASLAAAIVEVVLLWAIAPGARLLFYLATLLTALPMFAFLIAMLSRSLYGGTLHDPNGMRPIRIRIGSRVRAVDMNIVLVVVGIAVLLIAVMIFQLGIGT
jgi:hypothetical protein